MIGIYKITSPKGKIYIGQSTNVEKRLRRYKMLITSIGQTHLHRSFIKYGIENHKFEILTRCYEEQLNDFERDFQEAYEAVGKNGLNCILTKSGDKSGKLSEEIRKKIGDGNRGKIISEETRRKISESSKGRRPSDNTLEKARLSNINRITSDKARETARNLLLGNTYRRIKIENKITGEVYNSKKECRQKLKIAQATIEKILNDSDGYLKTQP